MGRRLALLIATYEYQDAGLRQLTAPAHDAESLAAVLRNPGIAGFEVTTLVNEPHHRVGEAIGDLYSDRRRDDLTLLYFTGHGLKDDDGGLYLAMTNTRRASLLFTSLPAEQINKAMTDCVSRQKVLILDCCYGGAFPEGRIAKADIAVHTLERFQGRGRSVLTASDAMQYSFEGNHRSGSPAQSVFTRHLVAGLRDGSADLDGDGNITIDELYSYVHDRVVAEMPQQRPKKQENVEGRIVIARNINWSLPPYLQNLLASPIATDRLGAVDELARLHRIGNDHVRQHVITEIARLTDDDSKLVSAEAKRVQSSLLRTTEADGQDSIGHPVDAPEPPPPENPQTPPDPAGTTVSWQPPRLAWLLWFVLGMMTLVLMTLVFTIGDFSYGPVVPGLASGLATPFFILAFMYYGHPLNAKEAKVKVDNDGITATLDGSMKKWAWDDIKQVSIRPFRASPFRRDSSPTILGLCAQAQGTHRPRPFGWPWKIFKNGPWTYLPPLLGHSDDPHIQEIADALSRYGRDRWTPNG